MGSVPPLLSFLLMIAAGWVHRHQLIVIEFLQAENRLLKDRLRGRRIRCTDAERAFLARKAKAVGRKALLELDTMVSPDTLLRWHRRLVAEKWNFAARRRPGRPGIMREISEMIVRMAQENRAWGYTRIQGALANLNHKVGRGTIANVLKRNGVEPAPERSRRTPWSTFLKAHWRVLAASDFLTVEVWTGRGLVTHYLLFMISLADRVVKIAGITTRPDEAWMLIRWRIDEREGFDVLLGRLGAGPGNDEGHRHKLLRRRCFCFVRSLMVDRREIGHRPFDIGSNVRDGRGRDMGAACDPARKPSTGQRARQSAS